MQSITNRNVNKLMIGTAQWGMSYGAYNNFGKCSIEEIYKIMGFMRDNYITDIDTSFLYGDAHNTLSKLQFGDIKIYSKIKIESDITENQQEFNSFDSLLPLENIYGLSIHNPDIIHSQNFEKAIEYLNRIKEQYNIQKIGISIYDIEQLDRLYKFWTPDIIQIPLNFFNNSFIKSGALEFMNAQGTEIHARSLFCQGLLLQTLHDASISEQKHRNVFKNYCDWCKSINLTQLEACVSLMKSMDLVEKFVLGFDNCEQLIDVTNTYNRVNTLKEIPSFDAPIELYDPRYWPLS